MASICAQRSSHQVTTKLHKVHIEGLKDSGACHQAVKILGYADGCIKHKGTETLTVTNGLFMINLNGI